MTNAWAIGPGAADAPRPSAVIGIDPGASGYAVCISLVSDAARLYRLHRKDLGTAKAATLSGIGKGLLVDPVVFMERPQIGAGDRKMARSLIFEMGIQFGGILSLVAATGWRLELVAPRSWQAAIHADRIGKTKERSLAAYKRLCPHQPLPTSCGRNPNNNAVDALLIAIYGATRLGARVRPWRFPKEKT